MATAVLSSLPFIHVPVVNQTVWIEVHGVFWRFFVDKDKVNFTKAIIEVGCGIIFWPKQIQIYTNIIVSTRRQDL